MRKSRIVEIIASVLGVVLVASFPYVRIMHTLPWFFVYVVIGVGLFLLHRRFKQQENN